MALFQFSIKSENKCFVGIRMYIFDFIANQLVTSNYTFVIVFRQCIIEAIQRCLKPTIFKTTYNFGNTFVCNRKFLALLWA